MIFHCKPSEYVIVSFFVLKAVSVCRRQRSSSALTKKFIDVKKGIHEKQRQNHEVDYNGSHKIHTIKLMLLSQVNFPMTEEQLEKAKIESGVLRMPKDFLPPEVRTDCQRIIPNFENIRLK